MRLADAKPAPHPLRKAGFLHVAHPLGVLSDGGKLACQAPPSVL